MDLSTGKIYNAEDAEKLRAAGRDMVPLKNKPKSNCKKCYGRGYVGTNIKTGKVVPCSCCYSRKTDTRLQGKGI